MTKEEIFEKLQTEVAIRGLSPRTYYTYKRAIDLFLKSQPHLFISKYTIEQIPRLPCERGFKVKHEMEETSDSPYFQ